MVDHRTNRPSRISVWQLRIEHLVKLGVEIEKPELWCGCRQASAEGTWKEGEETEQLPEKVVCSPHELVQAHGLWLVDHFVCHGVTQLSRAEGLRDVIRTADDTEDCTFVRLPEDEVRIIPQSFQRLDFVTDRGRDSNLDVGKEGCIDKIKLGMQKL